MSLPLDGGSRVATRAAASSDLRPVLRFIHKDWTGLRQGPCCTRQQAVDYFVNVNGSNPLEVANEADYIARTKSA